MRIGLTIFLAAGLSMPAMAADVIVTTPGAVAPPAVVAPAPPAVVVPSTPGVVVTPSPGDAERHYDRGARAQERANEAAAEGNYGIAAHEQEKADRNFERAQRDSSGAVIVTPH